MVRVLAGEHQVAHRHRARVKTNDKGIHGSIGHEGVGAVHVGDGLGEGLAHVRARMEGEFQQAVALNRLVLDALNAVDVEEVVFVVEDQIPFHLRRAHAAVRLGDVNDREIQVRKDVDAHAEHGQDGAHRHAEDDHHYRNGPPQRCTNQPHEKVPLSGDREIGRSGDRVNESIG